MTRPCEWKTPLNAAGPLPRGRAKLHAGWLAPALFPLAIVCSGRAESLEVAADKSQLRSTIQQRIVARGLRDEPTVHVDLFGRVSRVKVVGVSGKELTVRHRGSQVPIPWKIISDRRFLSIARSCLIEGDAERILLARFCVAAGWREEARTELTAARSGGLAGTLERTALALSAEIAKMRRKPAARSRGGRATATKPAARPGYRARRGRAAKARPPVPLRVLADAERNIFPAKPGTTYKEYWYPIKHKDDEGYHVGHHFGWAPIRIADDVSRAEKAELFAFGGGRWDEKAKVNGQIIDLPTLGTRVQGKEPYRWHGGAGVRGGYHRGRLPLQLLKAENQIELSEKGRGDHYLQAMAVRVYYTPAKPIVGKGDTTPPTGRLVSVAPAGPGAVRLRAFARDTGSGVHHVDFFAFYRGIDEDLNGVLRDWHGYVNWNRYDKDAKFPGGYHAMGHCGTALRPPYEVTWKLDLVPSGPVYFRCRIVDNAGNVVESPGGFVRGTVSRRKDSRVLLVPPRKFTGVVFAPRYQLKKGHQELEYHVPAQVRRAVLQYPGFGNWSISANGATVVPNVHLSHWDPNYFLGAVELPLRRGLNSVLLKHLEKSFPSEKELRYGGLFGCMENPGPLLILFTGDDVPRYKPEGRPAG